MKTEIKHITQITEISASDLQEMVVSSVRFGLQKFKQELETTKQQEENPERLLNPKEVCELLGISMPTLHNWKGKGILTSYGAGQKRYYKYSEVLKALQVQNRKK